MITIFAFIITSIAFIIAWKIVWAIIDFFSKDNLEDYYDDDYFDE